MRKREKDVIVSMFLPAAIVLIFTQVTGVAANIIDGVVTSRFLGADAYSAVSLLGPIANIVLLLASFISIGGQIVCSHRVGTGRRDEANAVFSVSILFGIGIALLFVLFSALSPATLFKICGVSVNEQKVTAIDAKFDSAEFVGEGVIIKKGKKVFHRAFVK